MTRRRAGYSLFEVLLAFAIMALVLAALLPGQARLLNRNEASVRSGLAMDLALSHLALMGVAEPLTVGETRQRHGAWTVTRAVVPQGRITGTDTDLVAVTVTVADARGRTLASLGEVRVAGP
ncbi:type IV pilus modification PilV family protein [Pseudaestuariivita atlantica]|uniref:General secretion pathway protein GspI n=1 Tax=Pseudaestuariivita atlantica TaxID=1317121 RepID=A0A0L1JPU4_9RHOB|nr:type II secretion system protein [Pseudaestuariivita atlantica]KNG93785.1 hypothetical protein ATO11_11460 [Pseudaestuariivita atlantica]